MHIFAKTAGATLAIALMLLSVGCGRQTERAADVPAQSASGTAAATTSAGATSAATTSVGATATGTVPASPAETQNTESAEEEDIQKPKLHWEALPSPSETAHLTDWPAGAERTVRTIALGGGRDDYKLILYAKDGDTDYLYAAFSADGTVYDLGPAAGYAYDSKEDISAEENVGVFGRKLVKLTGSVGASAALTTYFAVERGVPEPLLSVDTGLTQQLDLDFDGEPEVVASAGQPQQTYVYRWNGDHVEVCNLNAALDIASVSISPEHAVEAYDGDQDLLKLYWYGPSALREFEQYSMEEYTSDTFVKIPYEEGELRGIKETARQVGVDEPYVAAKGIATDYGIQFSAPEKDILQIGYPHFSIRQSAHDLRPDSGVTLRRKLELPSGPAEWIEIDGNGDWYLKRGKTYLSVGTAKPYNDDQLLYVVASLIPWEQQTASVRESN